jgi:hypothetical protein
MTREPWPNILLITLLSKLITVDCQKCQSMNLMGNDFDMKLLNNLEALY